MDLLRLDSCAGLLVGAIVLVLHEWLAGLYGLPSSVVFFVGTTNVLYGAYSGALALVASRSGTVPRAAILALIAGNFTWSLVCAGIVARHWHSASLIGLSIMAFEGLFVGALAAAEWRWLLPLSTPRSICRRPKS